MRIPACPQQPRALGGAERGSWHRASLAPTGVAGATTRRRRPGSHSPVVDSHRRGHWAVSMEGEKAPHSPGFLKENPSKGWNPVRDKLLSF
ncbi:unnamed protein product [Gulo gulo]|uniref:Uncharacterized protein n=1 Tax=Gulo gulo TaxID=48420 RepID=A0A9X9PZK4_GULGU|nr:unnamed protein product [Gulo gulo]